MPNKTWEMDVDINPSTTGNYNLGNASKKWVVNGYTLGGACEKEVDSSIANNTQSTNVPSSKAVVNYVKSNKINVSVSSETLNITTPQS